MGAKKSITIGIVAVLLLAGIVFCHLIYFDRLATNGRIIIDKFDSAEAPKSVEFGAKSLNQLFVESSKKSESVFGRTLRMKVKLIPDSYHFLASGKGLADKKFVWENQADDVNWDNVIGLSYKIFIESIKGTKEKTNLINVATDIIDDAGEIFRKTTVVHSGEWIEIRSYYPEFTTRDDYQRDWNILNHKVDRRIKSYQVEVLGVVTDSEAALKGDDIEVVLYIDSVGLIIGE